MKAFNEKVVYRNISVDPQTGKKDLIAGVEVLVYVYLTGTTTLAEIFDIDENPIGNPLTTDLKGNFVFKANDGLYDIVGGQGGNETRWDEIQLIDLDVSTAPIPFSFTAIDGQSVFTLEPSFGDSPTVMSVSVNGRDQDPIGSGGDSPSYTLAGREITISPLNEGDKVTGIASLDSIDGVVVVENKVVDIRDYGAVMNDPTVDCSDALLQAIAKGETVLIQGGLYYMSNTTVSSKCTLTGGGTFAPIAGSVDTESLITFTANENKVSNIHFNMLGTGIAPTRFDGNDNYISQISGRNVVVTATTFTSASLVLITGSRNTITNLFGQDLVNLGANSNPSVPRVITIAAGASYNTATNINGKNIAGGCIHGTGSFNVLDGFNFDNGEEGSAEMRNGIYSLPGSVSFTSQNGVINKCSQPLVDHKGEGNLYKSITSINCRADGIENSNNVTFDSITKIFTDKLTPNGGFLRTRATNVLSTNVTISNCTMVIPCFYSSILSLDVGAVDNLKVHGNSFTTQAVDGNPYSNIIVHSKGDNPIYTNNTFTVQNFGEPFEFARSWLIRFPANTNGGKWIDNTLTDEAENSVIRVVGALSKSSIYIDANNQLRADIGSAYMQTGYTGRSLEGIAPPNAGAWTVGDTIRNIDIDVTPAIGFEYKKYHFFVCTRTGEFGGATVPEFRLSTDMSLAPIVAPTASGGLGGIPLTQKSVSGTVQNLYESFSSADKSLILLGGFAGSLFKSTDTTQAAAPIASPVNSLYSVYGIDGADDASNVVVSGASYVGYSSTKGDSWTASTGIDYLGFDDVNTPISCDATGDVVLACLGERGSLPDATLNDIYVSSNGGATFTNKGIFTNSAGFVSDCHVAKTDSSKMYLVTKGTETALPKVGVSSDGGNTWSQVELTGLVLGELAYCIDSSADGSVVYVGVSSGSIMKSTDSGATFARVGTDSSENVRTLAVSRDGLTVVLGTNDGGYLRSLDSGATFALTEYAMDDTIRGLSINSTDTLMLGTSANGTYIQSEV